jgi:hypothetical protein
VKAERRIDLIELMRSHSAEWRHFYFKTDAHFNEAGNSAVAELLKTRLGALGFRPAQRLSASPTVA